MKKRIGCAVARSSAPQTEADLAQRRFMLVDPNNRLVADTLEGEWNEKLRILANAREERERAREHDQFILDKAVHERLVAMTADFKLWTNPETPNRERKRLLAHIIEDVTLLKLPKRGTTKAHIRFKGGKTQTLVTISPKSPSKQVKTNPDIIALIDKLLDDHIFSEIADILNNQGYRPGSVTRRDQRNARFTTKRVTYLVREYKLRSRYDRLRDRGMLTKKEAAAHLNTMNILSPDGLNTASSPAMPTTGTTTCTSFRRQNYRKSNAVDGTSSSIEVAARK